MLAGCSQTSQLAEGVKPKTASTRAYGYTAKDRECLARAMFFESRRSSREGLVAVGSVVMNRLDSGKHGDTVCDVVGEKGQFARGVLSRPMNSKALPDVQEAADAVLKGERHPKVKNAMFFHTAGLKFPYKNMHYVLVAGGNAFYEKRSRRKAPAPAEPETAIASAAPEVETIKTASIPATDARPVPVTTVARAEPEADQPVMSFNVSPSEADAIGMLIASQDRP
uniref:cell wall hydrolase n=1 Tax=unclassified Mesorhizobium TaxID=325217 RepID=UPI001FD22ED2|nr:MULTISPECIES: cell wall hydrolase [unclassified Mesorhizobium]